MKRLVALVALDLFCLAVCLLTLAGAMSVASWWRYDCPDTLAYAILGAGTALLIEWGFRILAAELRRKFQ